MSGGLGKPLAAMHHAMRHHANFAHRADHARLFGTEFRHYRVECFGESA